MLKVGLESTVARRVTRWLAWPVEQAMPRPVSFMILGIQKGGTTWLSATLDSLPCFHRSTPKETRFFNVKWDARYERWSDDRVRREYSTRHWRHDDGAARFDASPGYLASPAAARRVAQYFPDVQGVVLLREPVSRAFSTYNMWCRNGKYEGSFHSLYRPVLEHARSMAHKASGQDFYDAVALGTKHFVLSHGLYYFQLKAWFKHFSRDRIFVMTTKQLNDRAIYAKLLAFLGQDESLVDQVPFDLEDPRRHRGAPIYAEDRAELEGFYAPYNQQLFELLGVTSLNW